MVHAIDPDREGQIIWQERVGKGGINGGVQWGSAADKANVYVALSDVAYKFGAPAKGLSKTIFGAYSAPDPAAGGGLFALRLSTGERTWFTPPPGCGTGILDCSQGSATFLGATGCRTGFGAGISPSNSEIGGRPGGVSSSERLSSKESGILPA